VANEATVGQQLSIALLVRSNGDTELRTKHREFHLSAGVDLVAEAGADTDAEWVMEGEANEFWWPRGGSLREVLDAVPPRYGSIRALVRDFVPVPGDETFAERMIYRLAPAAPIANPGRKSRPAWRLVRRTSAEGPTLRGWYPVEVLRFPVHDDVAYERNRLEDGLAAGILRRDTRVRDALRALAGGQPLSFGQPDILDDAEFALDVAVAGEADVIRAQERLDELERRLSAIESTPSAVLKRKVRALLSNRPGHR
jgi:hypothetical protein